VKDYFRRIKNAVEMEKDAPFFIFFDKMLQFMIISFGITIGFAVQKNKET
jgi:hypothetical protein